MTRINHNAEWQLAHSSLQRDMETGVYNVVATFISGPADARKAVCIRYTLNVDDSPSEAEFRALAQIINSRRHPSEFEGAVLPGPVVPHCDWCWTSPVNGQKFVCPERFKEMQKDGTR